MTPGTRTVLMLAAVAAVGYAMLRSSNASAATVPEAAAGAPGAASGSGGASGSGSGSSLFSAATNALSEWFDSAGSSDSGSGSSNAGSSSGGPLPVAVTAVQDAPRVSEAVASVSPYRDPGSDLYGYSENGNTRNKQMNTD